MQWRTQKSFISCPLAALIFGCALAHAQPQTSKISTIKLEDFGWQPLPPLQRERVGMVEFHFVSFDHQDRVLVGFTIRENYGLATREHPGLSLHILRLTPDGKADLSLALPTDDYFSNGLYLGPRDQIFANANGSLQVLSEGNSTGEEAAVWKPLISCPLNCSISQLPSRRTMFVTWFDRGGSHTQAIVDASSFPPRVLQGCAEAKGQVADKFVYGSGSTGTEFWARRGPICDAEHSVELPIDMKGGFLYPLNDGLLLLLGTGEMRGRRLIKARRGIELVTPDGQAKFRQEMPKEDIVTDQARSDERGDRFAFIVETWRGGSNLLDISGKRVARRVLVYSDTGKELATIPISAIYHLDFDFAMSPDGHRLAILDGGLLTVADLD